MSTRQVVAGTLSAAVSMDVQLFCLQEKEGGGPPSLRFRLASRASCCITALM